MRIFRLLQTLSIALILMSTAMAAVPQSIPYQGRLLDGAGDPVTDGAYLIKFTIWDDPTASAPANDKWTSGFRSINVADGFFAYHVGDTVAIPDDLFASDTNLWLGIKVSTDPEIAPRTRLASTAFSYHSLRSDSADYANTANFSNFANSANAANTTIDAANLGGNPPSYYLEWSNLTSVPAGFADGIDNVGTGDITGVTAGSGLSGGGTSGTVILDIPNSGITASHLATNSVNSTEITNDAIIDLDINASANITVSKISGTAMNLTSNQTVTGDKTFTDFLKVGDSTFYANNTGIRIGDPSLPSSLSLIRAERGLNTSSSHYGFDLSSFNNSSTGALYGGYFRVGSTSSGNGTRYGLYVDVDNSLTALNPRYGIRVYTGSSSSSSSVSYGVRSSASGGTTAYGIYGYASNATTNYAGYFSGNVHVTGSVSKAGGSFKIDHPLDPANKYLSHSFVESPDMMNVYNGNVTLDRNGEASVTMPDYFETLNKDFRYQLTSIGAPGPNLYIATEISGGQFSISGGEPFSRVSWQVTGVRQDKWANANRIKVEELKPAHEQGKYLHWEEYNVSVDQAVNSKELKEDIEHKERDQPAGE